MKDVLDTNVACEVSRPLPDARCLRWLRARQQDCVLTTVTLAEMRYGVERLPESRRRRALTRNLDYLWQDYRDRVLPFDENAASEWGRYAAELEASFGQAALEQFDLRDTQIAAIARSRGLTVATGNVKHFPFVDTVDPYAQG